MQFIGSPPGVQCDRHGTNALAGLEADDPLGIVARMVWPFTSAGITSNWLPAEVRRWIASVRADIVVYFRAWSGLHSEQ